jgi:hypothetical protein
MMGLENQRVMASSASVHVRRLVLVVSVGLGLVGLYWIVRGFYVDGRWRFGNPIGTEVDPAPADPNPRVVRAEVVRVEGESGVRITDKCEFLVRRRTKEDQTFECNAQVLCGDKLLYGGPMRGYFPCTLYEGERRDVVGSDGATTSQDQDAALHLNTKSGVMRIWDDEHGELGKFRVEAEILSVR